MGHRAKGVYITGEALRGMKRLAVGKITINSRGERVINDTNWNFGSGQVKEGNIIPFGKVNVFVGMVHATESGWEDSMYKSGSEAAQSDGEESVSTAEVDLLNLTHDIHLEQPVWTPRREIEDDEEFQRIA